MSFLLNSQAQGVSGKMNNLPKHHGTGPPKARGPMQLHPLKAGPEWGKENASKEWNCTGKENASKEWNCIISMFLTSFNVCFVFGYACFMCRGD